MRFSVYLIYLLSVYLYIYLSIYLSVCLSIFLSVYVVADKGCGGSGACGIVIVVVLMLMLVIMLQSLFRNASGETLIYEIIVPHFFVFRKESSFRN